MTSNSLNTSASATHFDVTLQGVGPKRINVIKAVQKITSLGLRETKELVESAPCRLKAGIMKDEADIIKSSLEEVGATVQVRPSHPDAVVARVETSASIGGSPDMASAKSAAIEAALRRLDGLSKDLLVKREIKELPSILWEDELPEMLASGFYNNGTGILVATDRRVVFVDKGMFGSLKIEDFPYDKISSIESQTGILMGEITIYVSGNKEQIKNVSKGELTTFADFLRNKTFVANSKNRSSFSAPIAQAPETPATVANAPVVSVADELEKLAQLRDRGIITDEEFNLQKARLLQ